MTKPRFLVLALVILLSLGLATTALAVDNRQTDSPPQAFTGVAGPAVAPAKPAQPAGGSGDSLSGSYVAFDPSVGGDVCYIPGATQTFCFKAESFTNDWGYVYYQWQKFPVDWTVLDVYVQGTPSCTSGASWGTFAWSFQTSPFEVNISHPRYQASIDDCVAYYCYEVIAGTGLPNADESWYWAGDDYGSPPYHPCSSDVYTPAGQAACDESVNPLASIPPCSIEPGVYLLPPTLEAAGCNGVPQTHSLSLLNNTGSAGTFDMSYSVTQGVATLTGPATIAANDGEVVPFEVILTPDLCALPGDMIVGQIDTAGNGYADFSVISKTVTTEPSWEAIPASAPTWAGYGYPRDGCTAMNAAGQWVTFEIGDTSGIFGFWGYNTATNTWYQPGAANTPADRWAPDWAYDPDTNLCYLTGGANTPGGGTYNTAYVYDPVANAFTALGSFTSMRDFHNSWVGSIDGVKYLCIGGGVNSGSVLQQSTQCFDLAQTPPGVWNAENAQMAAFPTDPFGAADGILHAPGGDQFWYVGGAINNFATVTDEARYWDDADNSWHLAGNTGVPRYRVEGDFFNGAFYQLAGSSGGFTPTPDVVRGTFDGANWTWTTIASMANIRMDNVVGVTPDTVWSIDGYGATASAYVEKLAFCPECGLEGWLQGTVLDGDTQFARLSDKTFTFFGPDASKAGVDSLSGSYVAFDPSVGGDTCFTPGNTQTFCFKAESFTNDYAYVYNVWQKFPADWTVTNVYVQGTPSCTNGSWGTFSWSFETSPYEVNIYHPRYQSTTDDCVAYYCFEVTSGTGAPNADESWYWAGDNYGSPPYHPCSSDVYTPAGQAACDEAVNPMASVPPCQMQLNPTCTGATVTINPGDIHAAVDPITGAYGPVSLIPGDYTVEATAPGYSVETAPVTIVDQTTTIQDFLLYRPVVAVDPDALSVSAPPNTPVVVELDISNLGSLPLDWEIVEIPPAQAASVPAGTYKQQPAASGMDDLIAQQLAASPDGKADVFVAFKDTADLTGAYNLNTKAEKVQFVREALRQAADTAQANVRAWLDQRGISYTVFYVDNTLLIHVDQATINALAVFPEVSGFHGNHVYSLLPEVPSLWMKEYTVRTPDQGVDAIIPWDLNIISIPQVWDQLGVTGEGVIVANVDTGVYYQHEALFPNYLCGAGPHADCWFDPDGGTTSPNDTYGHGTSTMSQMAADNDPAFQYSVGGAPDAGWIACLGCPGGSCPDTALNGCADWLVMTTPNTPDIVNNSWGSWAAECNLWYEGKLQAYRAAGILPVFAAGNIGNACNTSTPPANNIESFAVGATTSSDVQAGFSSTGPGLCTGRTQFPDVAAPGDSTCGATNTGGYSCGLSGTSFAAPRAAGCLALMKSANPGLTIDEMEDVLMATADDKPNSDCGTPQDDPNYRYGDGRVNCLAAVSAVYAQDIPWVWENPITGTIPGGEYQPVEVTFECTPDQEGLVLTGTLRVNHNDPCAAPVMVPIEMFCGAPTPPDIEVVPPALSSAQLPDEAVVQQLNINNLGSLPLDWQIFEYGPIANSNPKPAMTPSSGTIVANPGLTASSGSTTLGTPKTSAHPEDVLWDQPLSTVNQAAYVNQEFTDYPTYSSFLADDFENTEAWTINTIFVPGDGWNGFSTLFNADSLTWQIYADNAGIPDGDPTSGGALWSLTLLPTDPQVVISTGTPGGFLSDTTLNLATPVNLPPGHYWLVFYPTLNFGSYGQFGRQPADTTNGYTGQFINPGGAFGYGTAWQAWTVLGPTQTDIAFRLEGSAGPIFVPCETPVDVPWLSVNPTSGTTPGHGTFPVDVTFDSTGMAPGDYSGNVCIASNDPDEPETFVPIALTVLVPAPPDIEVVPAALSSIQPPEDVVVQQLNINNLGLVPLDWQIFEYPAGAMGNPKPITPQANADSAPASRAPVGTMALGDLLFELDFGAATADTQLLGVEFDGTYYWVTGGNSGLDPNKLYKLDTTGALIATYDQASDPGWGWRDLAFDGTYLYGSDSAVVEQIDPATGLATGVTIPSPVNPARALAYDPATDHFWTANWDSDIYEFDRTGAIINDFAPVGLSTYGMAWDAVTAGGPFLWLWSQDGPDPLLMASQVNPATGALTGLSFIGSGVSGEMAGGAAISDLVVPGKLVFLGMNQGVSDRLGGYDLGDIGAVLCDTPVDVPWLSVNPTSGTTPGYGTFPVDATFDSTGMAPGDYYGNLCIASNDPDEPETFVPITLTVVEPFVISKDAPDVAFTGDSFPYTITIDLAVPIYGTAALTDVLPLGVTFADDLQASIGTATYDAGVVYWDYPGAGNLSNPEDILWDQPLSTVNQGAYVDQEFTDAPDYSSFLADDFVNTEAWNISTIFVPGDGWNGFSSLFNADSLTWQIYADNAGVPDGDPHGGGNAPVWSLTLLPTDPQVVITTGTPGGYPSNTTLNLVSPVNVPPGHYWLVFYPTMSFGSYGQFGRQPADTANGYTGQFINPGGGFGYGTAWQDWTVIGPTQTDIAFRLEGSVGPVLPSTVEISFWVTVDQIGGEIVNTADLDYNGDLGSASATTMVYSPAISLVKTVGLVEGVCATTDMVQTLAGTTVYYCYTATNEGNIALLFHDLVDDVVGTIYNDEPITLNPGESASVIVPYVVTTDVVNTGTWTGKVGDHIHSAVATDTAEVDVVGPAITLDKTVGLADGVCGTDDSIQVLPGTEVFYCFVATNTGDVPLDVSLLEDSELGVIFSGTLTLAPDDDVQYIVPFTVTVDVENTATVFASNDGFDVQASDSAMVDVVNPEIALIKTVGTDPEVCATTDVITVPVGTEVTYCYTVMNTGDITLTVHDLTDDILGEQFTGLPYELGPGQQYSFLVTTVIDVDTVNTGTWTACVAEGVFCVTGSDMATVMTYVPEVNLFTYLPAVFKTYVP